MVRYGQYLFKRPSAGSPMLWRGLFKTESKTGTWKERMRNLLLATTNEHKIGELRTILRGIPFTVLTPREIGLELEVEETGTTFTANALLKARAYAQAAHMLALADDSGLEIDALGGEPGVYSARFVRPDASYPERFRVIFERLRNVAPPERTARFRCVIALAEPSGYTRVVEGTVEGVIADAARGENGFGYDPIFLVPAVGKTTAEMTPAEKNRISHRARALEAARGVLADWPVREE